DVGIEVDDRHQSLLRVVVLEDSAKNGTAAVVELRDDVERRDLVEGVEDRVARIEIHRTRVGQHAVELELEILPSTFEEAVTEVVEDDEASLLKVRPEAKRLLVGHRPEAGLAHVGDRVLEELRVVEREDVRTLGIRADRGQRGEDLREMLFGGRIAVG